MWNITYLFQHSVILSSYINIFITDMTNPLASYLEYDKILVLFEAK
jgi:hypothetical protein